MGSCNFLTWKTKEKIVEEIEEIAWSFEGGKQGVITPLILDDIINRDFNNQTALTKYFDSVFNSDDESLKQIIKRFIRSQLQPIIKGSLTQKTLLGEDEISRKNNNKEG